MSFLNAVINQVGSEELREVLQERVDIIQHKIKFMDKVAVACLDSENNSSGLLKDILNTAGAELQEDAVNARVLIYCENDMSMLQLMGSVPALLKPEWPAVEYDRVYLYDDSLSLTEAETAVDALEDLAEMLYPGYFVFGNEGKTWMSFKTK
ncbi:hypothetical protein [Pedobacter sp. GR22-6]|uniref:hypothetical protein n=1 Tax=Pedobacter sp. GR22-6 TaxID=3127957 RepID=UPI00307FB9C4